MSAPSTVPAPGEFTLRALRSGDTPAVLELLRIGLGEGRVPYSEAFWRWKHEEGPFGPSPVLVAEAEDGSLVGLRAFLRWSWRLGDRDVAAVRPVDTATHPAWRGRGIFARLTRQLLQEVETEGVELVFNTPNRISGAGYRKMGWQPIGRAPVMVRPLTAGGMLRGLLRRGEAEAGTPPALEDLAPVAELLAEPDLASLLDTLLTAAASGDGSVDGVGPDRAPPRLRTVATRAYLDWRYARVPGLDYRAVHLDGPGGGALAVVHGRCRRGLREVLVAQLVAPPGDAGRQNARRLLRHLAHVADADYLATIASPGSPERAAFRAAGFLPLPRLGPEILVRRTAGASLPDPTSPSSWRFAAGDLELF